MAAHVIKIISIEKATMIIPAKKNGHLARLKFCGKVADM